MMPTHALLTPACVPALLSTAGTVEGGKIFFFYRPRCTLHRSSLAKRPEARGASLHLVSSQIRACITVGLLWSTQSLWMMCRGSS